MGMCKCEMTENGVCVTCTSGDSKCCEMIQACCDCLSLHDQRRLHLLRDDEQHPRLLRLLRNLYLLQVEALSPCREPEPPDSP